MQCELYNKKQKTNLQLTLLNKKITNNLFKVIFDIFPIELWKYIIDFAHYDKNFNLKRPYNWKNKTMKKYNIVRFSPIINLYKTTRQFRKIILHHYKIVELMTTNPDNSSRYFVRHIFVFPSSIPMLDIMVGLLLFWTHRKHKINVNKLLSCLLTFEPDIIKVVKYLKQSYNKYTKKVFLDILLSHKHAKIIYNSLLKGYTETCIMQKLAQCKIYNKL